MLGKLLKYEWKSTGRVLPLIYLAVLALSVCLGFSLRNSALFEVFESSNGGMQDSFASITFLSVYLILIVALAVVTIVVIISRFYRSMISQEGYLMHTLPVKSWQHIVSKTIMALVWVAIAVLVVIASFFLIGGASGLVAELREQQIVAMVVNEMEYFMGNAQIVLLVICTVVQGIRMILQVYLAMAIGGSVTKNKVMWSFLAFIVIAIVLTVINSVVGMTALMNDVVALDSMYGMTTVEEESMAVNHLMGTAFSTQLIMDGVLAVVFFILTNYFLKKRLNLE